MRLTNAALAGVFVAVLALPATAKSSYYGAVDVGSKGTKAALYSFKAVPNGFDTDVRFKKTINTKLVSSMVEGRFTAEGIQEAADAVRQLIEDMKADAKKHKISEVKFYVVGSSGVARGSNRNELVDAVKAGTGMEMTFVDAKAEGYFGLLSSVPRKRRSAAILIDVGSGNTKIGCLVGDPSLQNFKSAEIPYGSVSGRNEGGKRNPEDIKAGIDDLMQTAIVPAYSKESMDSPCLRNRQRIYWTGGAAWATATFAHPESSLDSFVFLTAQDVDTFLAALSDGTWNQKKLKYSFRKDVPASRRESIQAAAEKERENVLNVFVREDLLSGVSIMKNILKVGNPSAVIVFARNGNYIYGYALDRYKEDLADEEESAGN